MCPGDIARRAFRATRPMPAAAGGLASAGSGNQVIMSTHTDSLAAAAADAVTAPLDLLLTDAALGALRRMNPGGSGLRLAGALAVRPSLVASQGRQLLGEMARIAVGNSADAAVAARPAVHGSGLAGQPAAAPRAADLPGRHPGNGGARRRRGTGLGRHGTGWFRADQPGGRAGAKQQPGAQPGGRESGHRHRRRQRPGRPAALRRRHGRPAPGAVHGAAGRVRGRRGPRGHAGGGGPADPGVRADPVPARHEPRSGRFRC